MFSSFLSKFPLLSFFSHDRPKVLKMNTIHVFIGPLNLLLQSYPLVLYLDKFSFYQGLFPWLTRELYRFQIFLYEKYYFPNLFHIITHMYILF